MARPRDAAEAEFMARGGRTIVALACAAAIVAVLAPAALSTTQSSNRTTSAVVLESNVLEQLNAIRADHGLAPLHLNSKLSAAAEEHSREMAVDGYFDHASADGSSFSSRIAHWYPLSGYGSWVVGENILWASPSVGAARAVKMWMRSPDHRANILRAQWKDIGVGAIHASRAGGTFRNMPVTIITTDFGVRR
jgi:uncharacterized protein YkwD